MKIGYVVETFDKNGESLGTLGNNKDTVYLYTNEQTAKKAVKKLDEKAYTGIVKAIAMFEVEEDYED